MVATTEEVWQEFRERLRDFIVQRVKNEDDAEDLLQEVFIKIHRHLPTLRDGGKLRSWVYQITRHTIIDHFRSRQADLDLEETLKQTADLSDDRPPIIVQEIGASLRRMADDLPEKYREAFLLADWEGLTQQQVANRLGLSLSGAKSRVRRAREKLKIMLLNCCDVELDRHGNVARLLPRHEACSCRTDTE